MGAALARGELGAPPALVPLPEASVMRRREGGEVCGLLGRRLLLEVAVAQRGSGRQALRRVVQEQLFQEGNGPHRGVRELLRTGGCSILTPHHSRSLSIY